MRFSLKREFRCRYDAIERVLLVFESGQVYTGTVVEESLSKAILIEPI